MEFLVTPTHRLSRFAEPPLRTMSWKPVYERRVNPVSPTTSNRGKKRRFIPSIRPKLSSDTPPDVNLPIKTHSFSMATVKATTYKRGRTPCFLRVRSKYPDLKLVGRTFGTLQDRRESPKEGHYLNSTRKSVGLPTRTTVTIDDEVTTTHDSKQFRRSTLPTSPRTWTNTQEMGFLRTQDPRHKKHSQCTSRTLLGKGVILYYCKSSLEES